MPWDPAKLEIDKVTVIKPEEKLTNAHTRATLLIEGAGFAKEMFGVLVLDAKDPFKREHLIPCNQIRLEGGDFWASAEICPRQKAPGNYGLLLWAAPPEYVIDPDGNPQEIPVNDVYFRPNVLYIEGVVDLKFDDKRRSEALDQVIERLKKRT